MSSNSIDYSDPKIDAGGDAAYDSSNYGTTTGDLSSNKTSKGDFGPGEDKSEKPKTGTEGLRASGQDVVNHEQWGKNSGHAGQLGGEGGQKSSAPSNSGELSSEEAKTAQGYTAGGDSNPNIGG